MVGGKVYFRGPHKGYSLTDAKIEPIDDDTWDWLQQGLKEFFEHIDQKEFLFTLLSKREKWQCLSARTPQERVTRPKRDMAAFHRDVWDAELGRGGLVGDLTDLDRSLIPVITRGELRRFVPVWGKQKVCCAMSGHLPQRHTGPGTLATGA